jgi:hypothetical protein
MRNGRKICMKQCFPKSIIRMKDVTTLNAKVVNIAFTPQGHTYIWMKAHYGVDNFRENMDYI